MDDDQKNTIKTALTATKEEFTNEYQAISMLQESNAQIEVKITRIIQTENEQNKTIIEKETSRAEVENQLEADKENFLLEIKQINDKLANDRLDLLNQMHQIDDKRLLILQKQDYNQHIIDNLKSQENEYTRLENLYQVQYDQADSMINTIKTANETHINNLANNSMISKKDEKIKQVKQSIQNLDAMLRETKEKQAFYLNRSNELRKEIVNYRTSQINKFNEKIDDETHKSKEYDNTALKMQDITDTLNRKISMINSQINDIDNQISQILSFQSSQKNKTETKYNKISEFKENANELRHKSAELRDKLNNFLHNHSILQKTQTENKKTASKLKSKCDELTNLYKTETKLNKMLPELLTACCEADATLNDLENALNQINEEIEEQQPNGIDIQQQIKQLQEELTKLEEKLKIAKSEESQLKLITNIDNSEEDSFGFGNFKRVKTEKEMKIKTQIKKVKKQILSILLQTKEINMVLDRQNRSKNALIRIMKENKSLYDSLKECHENNINPIFRMQTNGNAKKIQNQIRNLEIRISTKKEVIKTMKHNLYNKSSLFVHTVHKANRHDLASTNSLNCDPVTKSLILKNHDKYCGVEHECTALNLLCKIESSKDYCIFCNQYNVPVV